MSDEVKEAYSPGLAGVIAGESAICWVHPDAGLAADLRVIIKDLT